jgi:hypothetical protein
MALVVLWGAMILAIILNLPDPPPTLVWLSLFFPVYYTGLSLLLHAARRPHPIPPSEF